jgi:hypothetical protein
MQYTLHCTFVNKKIQLVVVHRRFKYYKLWYELQGAAGLSDDQFSRQKNLFDLRLFLTVH